MLASDYDEEMFEVNANWIRYIGVFGTLCLFFKFSYFLSLIDQIAPLIDIIFQIVFDIKYFMLVLMIYVFLFAQCFQILSSSQIAFDDIDEEEADSINYSNLQQSLWFTVQTIFGGSDNSTFAFGDGKQEKILEGMFFAVNFLINLHMLNMLIAIMGGTYGTREAVGKQILLKDHLRLVLDNWAYQYIAFQGDIESLEYLIAAIPVLDDENDGISV